MDEADRMVNLGFEVDLTFILDKLPSDTLKGEDQGMMDIDGEWVKKGRTRVTTLFSATMPPAVERLTRKYLKKPAIITIGEAGRAVDTVEQRVEFVNGDEKKKYVLVLPSSVHGRTDNVHVFRIRMLEILNNDGFQPPIIVFVNQKKTADMVCKDIQRGGVRSYSLISEPVVIHVFRFHFLFRSGVPPRCIPARIKNSEKRRCSRYGTANQMCWLLLISQVAVSTCRMLVL
jgi:ATP-dependent RNA helicase DDX23/PRP28